VTRSPLEIQPDQKVDLRGKFCPFTVLELGKVLKVLKSGGLVEVLVEGAYAIDEIKTWCKGTGTEFIGVRGEGPKPESPESGGGRVEESEAQGVKVYLRKP
jgi:TusA-related sulfurtransferase